MWRKRLKKTSILTLEVIEQLPKYYAVLVLGWTQILWNFGILEMVWLGWVGLVDEFIFGGARSFFSEFLTKKVRAALNGSSMFRFVVSYIWGSIALFIPYFEHSEFPSNQISWGNSTYSCQICTYSFLKMMVMLL